MTDSNKKYLRNVTKEGVIISFVVAILLLIVAWFFEKGESWANLIILFILAVGIVNYFKTPKEKRKKTRLEFMEAVNSLRAGRMMKYFVYFTIAFVVLTAIMKYIL